MDPITAISLITTIIQTAIKIAPIVVQGVGDLKVFAVTLFEKFTGKTITPEQRSELEAKIEELHSEFQAPIPSEDQR